MAPQVAAVVTVEIDPQLYQLASEELFEFSNVTMLHLDALKNKSTFNPRVLEAIDQAMGTAAGHRLKLVANLPYNIGTPVISNLLSAPIVPVALDGVYPLWPRKRPINWALLRPWRRPRVALRFGPPLPAPVLATAGASHSVDSLAEPSYAITTARLREVVDRMWRDIRVSGTRTPRD